MADPMTTTAHVANPYVAPVANPYVALALGGASVVTDIIGLIMQKQAMGKAAREAKVIDARNFAYQQGRDEEGDRMNRETIKLSKQKLSLDRSLAMHGIKKDNIAQIENMFNTNIGLQDRLLKMWSR